MLTYTGAGNCVVRATAAATSTYAVASTDVTFTITVPGTIGTSLSITSFVNDVGNSLTASGTAAYGTAGDSGNVTVVFCLANAFPCSSANTLLTKTVTVNTTNGAWTAQTGNVNKLIVWVQATQTRASGSLISSVRGPVTG
ncbi:MAG: hypothetical protein HHJ13_13870 [Phycicoccus sp.]|nr:hypothetical protein [Phycicoccus sp.]